VTGAPSDAVRRARELLLAGRLGESERVLDAMTAGTNDAQVVALRGMLAAARNDDTGAATLLERSLRIKPTFDAAICLGRLRYAAGFGREIAGLLATAFRLNPQSTAAHELHRRAAPPSKAPARPLTTSRGHRRPLSIWFSQANSIPYDGDTPRDQPLGGTESAVVYLADALAEAGHVVRVYNGCADARRFRAVEYHRWQDIRADALEDAPDVLISIRDWSLIGQNRFAPLQLLWTGDPPDQPSARGLEIREHRTAIDYFVFQSQWHAGAYRTTRGIDAWRIVRTRLGFAPVARTRSVDRRPPRLIYASTPCRGLDLLLEWFPIIRQRCPEAELRVCSSLRLYGVSEEDDRAQFGALYERARQPGVVMLGSLPQPALAAEYEQARVLAYPNRRPETFCITVVEAQAAGCPVVTSTFGALPETVGNGGVCVSGDPDSDPTFRDRFVDEVVAMLTDDDRWCEASRVARERAAGHYNWRAIASEWSDFCYSALAGDVPELERIAHHLSGRRYPLARRIIEREGRPETVTADAWTALGRLVAWLDEGTQPVAADLMAQVQLLGPLRRIPAFDDWTRQAATTSAS